MEAVTAANNSNRPAQRPIAMPTAEARVSARGRRWAQCPGCTAIACPIASAATSHRCQFCGCEFALVEAPARRARR
jgi:hypothetical protein